MGNSVFICAADRGVGEQLPPQMRAELLLGQLRWIKGAQGLLCCCSGEVEQGGSWERKYYQPPADSSCICSAGKCPVPLWLAENVCEKLVRELSFVPHQTAHQYFTCNWDSWINLFLLECCVFVGRIGGIVTSLRCSLKSLHIQEFVTWVQVKIYEKICWASTCPVDDLRYQNLFVQDDSPHPSPL